MTCDISVRTLIRSARIRENTSLKDISIEGERIAAIEDRVRGGADSEINAEGNLVTSGLVNPHLHLDKVLTGDLVEPSLTLEEAIRANIDYYSKYNKEEIKSRGRKAIETAILYGTTAVRAFVDVDRRCGLKGVEAMLELKNDCEKAIDIQVTPFIRDYREKEDEELLIKAMKMKCDVVGGQVFLLSNGMPEEQCREYIDKTFEIAKQFKVDIHVLVDDQEDPNSHLLEYTAVKTIQDKYQGHVTASHAEALSVANDVYADKVVRLAKNADMSICANGHVNLGREDIVLTRGNTRVEEFLRAGVNVTCGQDDINDFYYPFGKGDMLEVAFLASHIARLTSPSGLEIAYNMVTTNAAKAIGLNDYGLRVGAKADLVILGVNSIKDALRLQPDRTVIKNGNLVARTRTERHVSF